ncbi:ABC transporter ATP-binding protein [Vibrio kanaloae]|uniref:ABC transporter ATP-binding protein n=1 Tax=Vibrio kanaloae TaxID=170673 RepID=UPI0010BDD2FC|nr:ABC transporter ATP-binding protein [Vibrio kanaloae]TKE98686.1 ABC transporter ATP-binding protein [Vibrio kanaloae]TKF52936.1 ABC transporter ATP-binding protein [Vibrio kanaloae]
MYSDNLAIKVDGLNKSFRMYNSPKDRVKELFLPKLRNKIGLNDVKYSTEFKALTNINFEIKKGETVGIIGHNGCGKSTLLQIICGTLSPTTGEVKTFGRIAALLELGSGFNPEFTGTENVYMGCALLGLSKKETDECYDAIVKFADIGDFIHQPVKNYSSGMFVRLAFAVNIVSQPDIMIVDEALSVGDMNFQAKCMTALLKLQNAGATILFVSHDINAVKSLCERAIYIENGMVKNIGSVVDVTEQYVRDMRLKMNAEERSFDEKSHGNVDVYDQEIGVSSNINPSVMNKFISRVADNRYGTGDVKVLYADIIDSKGYSSDTFMFNEQVKIRMYIRANADKHVSVNANIQDAKKIVITQCSNFQINQTLFSLKKGEEYLIEYNLRLPFEEGVYTLQTYISEPVQKGVSGVVADVIDDVISFQVSRREDGRFWAKVYLFPQCTISRL